MAKSSIIFNVTACQDTGGYVARWDDEPGKGGITTQGETLSELEEMIADAVTGYFEAAKRPQSVKLHFAEDPVVAL
jgi:predicted RNase H-like HicB family nuclease